MESDFMNGLLGYDAEAVRLGTVIRANRVGWLAFAQSALYKETVVALTTKNIEECAFTGKGDLIAIGYPGRVALVNASGRGARGGVDIGAIPVLAMDPRGEFMLTSDGGGVTLRPLPDSTNSMLSGRSTLLVIPGSRWRSLAVSADGNRVWVSNAASNMVYGYTRDFDTVETVLGPHEFAGAVAAPQTLPSAWKVALAGEVFERGDRRACP